MGTTAQKLQNIIDAKNSISAAIEAKGGTVPAELTGYGPAIEALPKSLAEFYGDFENGAISSITVKDLSGLTNIREYMFSFPGNGPFTAANSALIEVEIPNTISSIGQYAFQQNRALLSVSIPNSVSSIGASAFRYCMMFQSLNIPSSVSDIGGAAFSTAGGSYGSGGLSVTFEGRTMAEVQAMSRYSWGARTTTTATHGATFICTDGTITF